MKSLECNAETNCKRHHPLHACMRGDSINSLPLDPCFDEDCLLLSQGAGG